MLRHRISPEALAQSYLYTISREDGRASNFDLQCYRDTNTADQNQIEKSKIRLASRKKIVSLNAVPVLSVNKAKESHDIIVVHDSGELQCFSAALEETLWTANLHAQGIASTDIEHVEWLDLQSVKTGFLTNRPDLLAALEARFPGLPSDRARLMAVMQSTADGAYEISIFLIQARTAGDETNMSHGVESLFTVSLPLIEPATNSQNVWSMHAASGTLQLLRDGSITSYDLSTPSAKLMATLAPAGPKIDTFVRLSESLVIGLVGEQVSIFDTKFGALQSSQVLITSELEKPGKKRKRSITAIEENGPTSFIGFLPRAELALALRSGQIVAISLTYSKIPRKRRTALEEALAQNIGKGVQTRTIDRHTDYEQALPSILGQSLESTSHRKNNAAVWHTNQTELDRMIATGEVASFDRAFAKEVGYRLETIQDSQSSSKKTKKKSDATPLAGTELEDSPKEPLTRWIPLDKSAAYMPSLYRSKALFALSRIFALSPPAFSGLGSGDGRSILEIVFFPPNTFQWLTETGHLTQASIDQALTLHNSNLAVRRSLSDEDLMSAIADLDPSLRILYSLLDSHPHLEIADICQAVKCIIRSLDSTAPPQPNPHLIDDINVHTNGLTNGTDGDAMPPDENAVVDTEADAAMDDLDYALTTLEDGLPIRRESLSNALTKLNAFGTKSITSCLQRMLNQDELVYLIHILRSELAYGGWTTRYIDNESRSQTAGSKQDEDEELHDHAIAVIARILCCTVDAIGIAGWVASSATSPLAAADDLLYKLRGEISAALEGVHEAAFLNGLVGEFLRYSNRRVKNGDIPLDDGSKSRKADAGMRRQVVVRENDKHGWEANSLPLGLKVREKIDPIKVLGGSGIMREKTMRERGEEISIQIGKYSFEKIRFPERKTRKSKKQQVHSEEEAPALAVKQPTKKKDKKPLPRARKVTGKA